jgi:branched-chain amino acid transport system permease protein
MKDVKKIISTENICAVLLFVYLIFYPFLYSEYRALNMANFLITIMLTLSLAIVWGLAGMFSWAQCAFFGLSGYTYAILCKNFLDPALTPVFLITAVIVGFVGALFLGYFMFYGGINDVFIGLVTMCFTLVIETFFAQTAGPQWKIGEAFLGGYNGINAITPLTLGEMALKGGRLYVLVLMLLIVLYIIIRIVERGKLGYSLISIRENRERSEMFGYNIRFIQTMIYAFCGALAGLAGVLYTSWGGYIVPTAMGLTQATTPIVLVAAGGRKNPTAVVIFTLIYLIFAQNLAVSGSEYSLVVLGLILLLVVLFVPKGIIHSLFELIDNKFINPLIHGAKKTNVGGSTK